MRGLLRRSIGVLLISLAVVLGVTVGPIAYNVTSRLMQYYHILAVEIERRAPDQGLEFIKWIWPIALLGCAVLLLLMIGMMLAMPEPHAPKSREPSIVVPKVKADVVQDGLRGFNRDAPTFQQTEGDSARAEGDSRKPLLRGPVLALVFRSR